MWDSLSFSAVTKGNKSKVRDQKGKGQRGGTLIYLSIDARGPHLAIRGGANR
jgi:hypothetical protein